MTIAPIPSVSDFVHGASATPKPGHTEDQADGCAADMCNEIDGTQLFRREEMINVEPYVAQRQQPGRHRDGAEKYQKPPEAADLTGRPKVREQGHHAHDYP